MMTRIGRCYCGSLRAEVTGEPPRVSICHCMECQRRTGSAFGVVAFFPKEQVGIEGQSKVYVRASDSGRKVEFHFCPDCGTSVFWYAEFRPDHAGIALGTFTDPSMVLHELFFASLGGWRTRRRVAHALIQDFGSIPEWITEFTAIGKALRGGSGWLLLTWSPRDRKLVNQWAMDHSTTLADPIPILALDMYEHSYHMDFGAQAALSVDAFMGAINWPCVGRLFAELRR